ncbi:MAG: hypothetical protein R3C45_07640 [Phycisphaerales bacterium]
MTDPVLFETSGDELLVSVYARQGRTLDDLPYTEEFERVYEAMTGGDETAALSRQALFHRLHNLRKAGKLPRLGKAQGSRPRLNPEQEALLAGLVCEHVGELSKRDQLLYTEAFDTIVNTFNTRAGLSLSAHDAWRIIAKLAK